MVKQVRKLAHTPTVRVLLVLTGGVVAVLAGIALSPVMDFSPAVEAQTQCEQKYQQCMQETKKQPPTKTPQQCEEEFKKCVLQKCPESKTACTKTPECEAHCTESADSKTGIKTCCEGGPKHQNSCPNKLDGNCSPKKTMPPGDGKMPGGGMMPKEMMGMMMGGMPMLPMLPMPMPKMDMPMMMMASADCSGALQAIMPSPECAKGKEGSRTPISDLLDQSKSWLQNLWNGDTFNTGINGNDVGGIPQTQGNGDPVPNVGNIPGAVESTFGQGLENATPAQQLSFLQQLQQTLQGWLNRFF